MESQIISIFIHETIFSKMLPHWNDINASFNSLPDRAVTGGVSKLGFFAESLLKEEK